MANFCLCDNSLRDIWIEFRHFEQLRFFRTLLYLSIAAQDILLIISEVKVLKAMITSITAAQNVHSLFSHLSISDSIILFIGAFLRSE